MLREARIPVYLIALGAFALGMASYVTAGLIPLIEQAFVVSVAVAAQLVTAFTLAYGLGAPIVVALVPAHRQRIGLLAALLVFVLANIAAALAPSFGVLLVFRAIAGVGAGVYLAMGIAAASEIAGAEQAGKSIAVIMAGMASGTVFGVPLSLLMAEQLGWASALWLVALLGAMALIGLVCRLPLLPARESVSLRLKLGLLTDRNVIRLLLVSLLAAVSSLGLYTFIAPLLSEARGDDLLPLAAYLWVWGIGGVLGSYLIGLFADRFKGPHLVLAIMLLLALSLSVLPIVAALSRWLVLLPIALWGAVGWALQVPQNQELIKARAQQGDSNLAVALNESALYLGSAIGAVLGGMYLLHQGVLWTMALVAAALALLGALTQLCGVVSRK